MPRVSSAWTSSSLFPRTEPASVNAQEMKWAGESAARCSRIASAPDCSARTRACAALSNGATGSFLFQRFEAHRHDVRQVNGGLRRQRYFDMLIRFDAVDHLDAGWNAVAV